MQMIVVGFAVVFGTGIFIFFLALDRSTRVGRDFDARLAQYGGHAGGVGVVLAPPPRPRDLRERLNQIFQPAADRLGQRSLRRGRPSVAEQLARADLKLRPSELLMLQVGCTVVTALVTLVRFGIGPQFILTGIGAYFLPGLYVRFRQRQRRKAFNAQLGDTMLLLSNALKAGYSFAQAMDTVARNGVAPVSDEFARAVREMNLGGSVDEALANMVRRVDSPDLDMMVTAVSIHRQVGGNLAEILDTIAETIRARIRLKGEIATMTAQASASGTIITLLPIGIATFLYFLVPTYFLPMTQCLVGGFLIGVAVFMIAVGNAIIRKIVAIDI